MFRIEASRSQFVTLNDQMIQTVKSKQIATYSEADIVNKIYIIRGQKVMLDKDLAEMYDVAVKVLNQAVKRNADRFPEDFMFQLSNDESGLLRSQIVTLKKGSGKHPKYDPYVFTEQGVAMLSSVLRSERAIQVNIQILRVYTKMKHLLLDNKELWLKIEKIEHALVKKDEEVQAIFNALKNLLLPEEKPRPVVGFKIPKKKKK